MIISDPFPIMLHGEPATLRVLRNDGFCWGHLTKRNGSEWIVHTRRDYYDEEDAVAAEGFHRMAKRWRHEPSAIRYNFGHEE